MNEINVEVMVNAGEKEVTHRVVLVLFPFSIFFLVDHRKLRLY